MHVVLTAPPPLTFVDMRLAEALVIIIINIYLYSSNQQPEVTSFILLEICDFVLSEKVEQCNG